MVSPKGLESEPWYHSAWVLESTGQQGDVTTPGPVSLLLPCQLSLETWRHWAHSYLAGRGRGGNPTSALRGLLKGRGLAWVKGRSNFRGGGRLGASRPLFVVARQAKASTSQDSASSTLLSLPLP